MRNINNTGNINNTKNDNENGLLISYDCSGSTSNSKLYHSVSKQAISKHASDFPQTSITYTRWDSEVKEISKEELEKINDDMTGYGQTFPVKVAEYIIENKFHGTLLFISDGEISGISVKNFSDKLIDWKFKKVYVYLISTSAYSSGINESISCAITRNTSHEIFVYKNSNDIEDVLCTSISQKDLTLLEDIDNIHTVDNFMNVLENIKNPIISMNMGTSGNKKLHTKLVSLKNRIIKSGSKDTSKAELLSNLEKSFDDKNPSLDYLSNIWNGFYTGSSGWIKEIDTLISWCSGSLLNVFNREDIRKAASNREEKASITIVVPTEMAEIKEIVVEEKYSIACPISLDNTDYPIILIRKVPTDFEIPDSFINCPLSSLSNNDFISYVKSFIDSIISLESYKELVDYGISDRSPLTRSEIIGGICLGSDDSHVKVTNSTLRHALSKGKAVGNIDLWFAVIYFMVEKGHVPHLTECLPAMRDHMIYRLKNSVSYMCLSGLPSYPTYSVKLGTALWCSISASACGSSFLTPKTEPLRMHLSYSQYIVELLKLVGVEVPEGLQEHINNLKVMRYFLNEVKKGKDVSYNLVNTVNALTFKAIKVNTKSESLWIPIDGKITDAQIITVRGELPRICDDLSNSMITHILGLCDVSKSESDINIPFGIKMGDGNLKMIRNWKYDNENVPRNNVAICPLTCRPYYNIIDNGTLKTWLEKATEVYGEELFSTNKFYSNYIVYTENYPTREELLVYIYKYFSTRGKPTLPMCIEQFIDEVFIENEDIVKILEPSEYIKRYNNSVYKNIRINMESGLV